MADPFSLMGQQRPSQPMARPSFFDKVLGRGNYMQEFATGRKEIIREARQEKQRLSREMRRNKREYELKLRRDKRELYQEFGIKASQRANQDGLSETDQDKMREQAWVKINKQMRKQQRAAERDIEHQRDRKIKDMRDSLRAGVDQSAEVPQAPAPGQRRAA